MEPEERTNATQLEQPLLELSADTTAQEAEVTAITNAESSYEPSNERASDPPRSRNIPLTLWYQAIRCAGEAIWLGNVLAAYVYLSHPNNPELIGVLSALEGIVQFIAACGAGVLGDRYTRDVLLKAASAIGMTASCLLVASCINPKLFVCLAIALGMNGAFDGIGLTASLAIFSDSIKDGDRSYYFTQRNLCTTGGQFFGPICGLAMFYALGDKWTVAACAKVIGSAQIFLAPAFVMLCFFQDETANSRINNNRRQPSASTDSIEEGQGVDDEEREALLDTQQESQVSNEPPFLLGLSRSRIIAISASLSDILCAVAYGMSLRYFTIFQLDSLKLSPVVVMVLDALSCVLGGALLVGAQRLATSWGRCRVSVLFKALGVAFLLLMIQCYQHGRKTEELLLGGASSTISTGTKVFVCIAYLLQNAFLCSTSALTQSLAMDHVPAGERAKWSALESINIFGWCGSAAIGGMLVAHFGSVLPVFFITSCLQVIGTLPLVALIAFGNEALEHEQSG